MALGDSFERREFSANAVATTLDGAMGGTGAVTPSIADATGWPDGSSGPFYALFNGVEIVEVTSRTSTTLTIASGGRGKHGTSAVNHASGTSVVHIATLPDFDEANQMVNILGNGTSGYPLLGAGTTTAPAYGQVNTTGIADSAVTSAKIAAGTIATSDIADDAVTAAKIADGAIDAAAKLATGVVTSAAILDGTIATGDIADDAVTAAKIADGAIDAAAKFGAGVVDAAAIAADAVGSSEIAADAVGLSEAADAILAQFITFGRTGTLTTGTGTTFFRCPVAMTVQHVRLYAGTAPTGASIIVDVNKNGTTMFTTQGNRPTMTAGQQDEDATTAPDVTALAAGDRVSVDIDQVGSTVAGADLVVVVYAVLA